MQYRFRTWRTLFQEGQDKPRINFKGNMLNDRKGLFRFCVCVCVGVSFRENECELCVSIEWIAHIIFTLFIYLCIKVQSSVVPNVSKSLTKSNYRRQMSLSLERLTLNFIVKKSSGQIGHCRQKKSLCICLGYLWEYMLPPMSPCFVYPICIETEKREEKLFFFLIISSKAFNFFQNEI